MEPNIKSIQKAECAGCLACVALCPKSCISIRVDELGFQYPEINEEECVHCGLCYRSCKKNTGQVNSSEEQHIYAVKNADRRELAKSSSGAVFPVLANYTIKQKGVVFGSVYKQYCQSIEYDFAETEVEVERMRGSKYSYSKCSIEIFKKVQDYLRAGRHVLFTGTPCQVAALKTFLKTEYENLFLVDILCHGVESPRVYKDFIDTISKIGKVKFVDFRTPKHDNWHEVKTTVMFENGRTASGIKISAYFNIFVGDWGLRPSCYKCNYCRFERCGDITLGDFWGIERTEISSFDSPDGCSVVLVNTPKGVGLFNAVREDLSVCEVSRKQCFHQQLNGLPEYGDKSQFERDYLGKGYDYVANKYGMPRMKYRIRDWLYSYPWIWNIRKFFK